MLDEYSSAYGATDSYSNVSSEKAFKTELSVFPAQDPPESVLKEWIEQNDSIVRQEFGPLLRGETPTQLIRIKDAADADLSDLSEVAVPTDADAKTRIDLTRHNHAFRKAKREKKVALDEYVAKFREHRDKLAKLLERSLRPHAELRLLALQKKHKEAGHEAHKGDLMYKELLALVGKTGVHEEIVDHDKAVERIRETRFCLTGALRSCSLKPLTR
jgi:hypothetical protein